MMKRDYRSNRTIRIECLELDQQTAIDIAKVLRQHLTEIWATLEDQGIDVNDLII